MSDWFDKLRDKRLSKSRTNKKICGVCGGLAEYLDMDPTVVRVATLVLMAIAGSGILVYLAAAVIMPEGENETVHTYTNYSSTEHSGYQGRTAGSIYEPMQGAQDERNRDSGYDTDKKQMQ